MAAIEDEVRGFPKFAWGPVIAGVLLALASHVVLGLIGGALGFAAQPADSRALGALAGFWALLTPFVATALGAWLACRLAAREDTSGTNLHGVMVWAIGLVAGAVFLASTMAGGAMAAGTAASGNAFAMDRMMGARPGGVGGATAGTIGDEAAKRAATAAGGGAMAGLCGLLGAFVGAAIARTRWEEKRRGLGWRIAIQRTDQAGAERRAQAARGAAASERRYGEDVRDMARDEGPGAPPTEPPPYHH